MPSPPLLLLLQNCSISERSIELEHKKKNMGDDGVLKKGIAKFYDESFAVWEDIWGYHRGFYPLDSTVSLFDHPAAQIRMIKQALTFAEWLW
ncbi:hypothetical protein PIB30_092458, partial [Stylosanthes scabra]|nr:hypothetical protein [Stylosanthes scabra]